MRKSRFWEYLEKLIAENTIVLDRPKGSSHPRYPELVYPLDYGYLAGTTAADGEGIDVWIGSLPSNTLVGCLCTVDLLKKDVEIKLLIGCSQEEIKTIQSFHASPRMENTFIPRNPVHEGSQDDEYSPDPSGSTER